MTGRELHRTWRRFSRHRTDWPALAPWEQLAWDRLAAEVVPISEAATWLWTSAPVDKAWQREQISDSFVARFAPGTGEQR